MTAAGVPTGATDTTDRVREQAPAAGSRPLRVLHTLRRTGRGGSTYSDLVLDTSPTGVDQRFFSWSHALVGRYDVLHAHWPEQLVRDSRRPRLQVVRRRLLDLLLLRLRLQRIPLVWTAHNVAPHERGSRPEARSLARFARSVHTVVTLTPAVPVEVARHHLTVPHAHYRRRFAPLRARVDAEQVPGRFLHFGIIRPYKAVETLLEAFTGLADPAASLRVVGQPHGDLGDVVRAAAAVDPRVSVDLRYVDDEQLVREVLASELVVLPYRGLMHNSGALLAALSLDRPVLVPASPTNDELARRVGPGWVLQYQGPLDEQVLADGLARARAPRSASPDLSAHDPVLVAERHGDLYAAARADLRGRGTR